MSVDHGRQCRLSPAAQAAYQKTFDDPKQKGSLDWHIAGRALIAAGVLGPEKGGWLRSDPRPRRQLLDQVKTG